MISPEDAELESMSPPQSRSSSPSPERQPEGEAAAVATTSGRFDKDVIEEVGMWVFGYGSLCWNQGFSYQKSMTGFVRGFSRKFWQGNTTHRGTQEKPGRVATLVEEKEGLVWGQAFQVQEEEAFSYLNNRECQLGGYLTIISTFYPREDVRGEKKTEPFPVILYLATSSNPQWLGDSPLAEIADQIVESTGNSGHNVEYLLRLADFVRENIPEAEDDHLFTLEGLVRSQIRKRNLCLETLMGEGKTVVEKVEVEDGEAAEVEAREVRTDVLQFTSTVPSKKLRCVNI